MDSVGSLLTGEVDMTLRRHAVDTDEDRHLSRLLRDEESDDDSDVITPLAVDTWHEAETVTRQSIQDIRQSTRMDSDRQSIPIDPDSRQSIPIDPDSRQSIPIDPDSRQSIPIDPGSRQSIPIDPGSRQSTQIDSNSRQSTQMDLDSRQSTQIDPDNVQSTQIGSDSRQITQIYPDSMQITQIYPESMQITQIYQDSMQITQIYPDSMQITRIYPDSMQITQIDPESGQITQIDPESRQITQIDLDNRQTSKVDSDDVERDPKKGDDSKSGLEKEQCNEFLVGHTSTKDDHSVDTNEIGSHRSLDFESNELGGSGHGLSSENCPAVHRNIEESDNEDNKSILDESTDIELNNPIDCASSQFLENDTSGLDNRLVWSDKNAPGEVLDKRLDWSEKDITGEANETNSIDNRLGWKDKNAPGEALDKRLDWSDKDVTGEANEANSFDKRLGCSTPGIVLDKRMDWRDKNAPGVARETNSLDKSDTTGEVLDKRLEIACDDIGIVVGDSGGVEEDAGVGHLLHLVRELANALPTSSYATGGGQTNLGFDATDDQTSDDSSGEEIDWSWLADEAQLCAVEPRAAPRPSSWLRASMRRVRHFALGEPAPTPRVSSAPPLARSLRAASAAPARPSSAPRPSTPPPPAVMSAATSERLPPLESPLHVPVTLEEVVVPPETPDFPRRYSHLGRQAEESPVQSQPQSDDTSADEEESECTTVEGKDRWPHSLSSLLAALGCTLGLFNVARFALLSVHFGGNFVVAFLLLSALLGWPLYALHATLGSHLRAGVVDMWHVSPVFQGVGVALLMSQAAIGLYSVVGVAWMFTYFRDSFVNRQDSYRWAENGTQLEYSVSAYLKSVVLQQEGSSGVGHLKFQVSFNLAVVWMIVFVCLSKGIKSYGKAVHLLGILPILGLLTLTGKMLTLTPVWFDTTAWGEFLVNTNCWAAATVECFSTWGLLGAATMQLRTHAGSCRLAREVASVGLITVATLLSAALLANCCAQLLRDADFTYVPSSYEHSAVFLQRSDAPHLSSTPVSWMPHAHMIVGQQVFVPGVSADSVSGYQVVRFATELGPAVFATLGPEKLSPFWTVLFYFTLICFGVGQQLCIWHCVITGVIAINKERMQAWETTITFLSCTSAFVLGLPFTTERGAVVLFYLDYCIGGAWWLLLLMATQIVAALMAQGGEQVARSLLCGRRTLLQAALVFTWNLALPVALTVASVTWFKTNNYRDLYTGRTYGGYWPAWARRLGCLIQLAPLLTVPLVAAIQTWRHLTSGPQDLFDRLRLLCRPGSAAHSASVPSAVGLTNPSTALPALTPLDDPPPKYTPPPSYATATGARIAKLLRRSFRRLVGPSSAPEPPAYSAALVELGGVAEGRPASTLSANQVARLLRSSMRRTLRSSAPGCLPDSAKPDSVILS